MPRPYSLFLAMILGCCCVVSAAQKNNTAALALFQTRYDGITRAFLAKDVIAGAQYFSPDYSAGDYNHPIDKKGTLEQLRNYKGQFRTVERKVLSVIVNGKKATAITDMTIEGHLSDLAGTHRYVITCRTMDTWVHNSQWQMKHSRVISKKVTKDGKPVVNRSLGG